jgi:hypothetical protein
MLSPTMVALVREAEAVGVDVPPAAGFDRMLDFSSGGLMMYPLALSALAALALAAWSAWRLWGGERRVDARVEAGVDGVLFWGGFALLLGILGTVIGIAQAAQAIAMAGEVSTTLVGAGIRVTLITTIWGALILAASAVLWFFLRVRCRTLLARAV